MKKLVIVQRILNKDIPTQYIAINEAALFVVFSSDTDLLKVDKAIKNYSIHVIHNNLVFTPIKWPNIADITSGLSGTELYSRLASGMSPTEIAQYSAYRWIENNMQSAIVFKAIDLIMNTR